MSTRSPDGEGTVTKSRGGRGAASAAGLRRDRLPGACTGEGSPIGPGRHRSTPMLDALLPSVPSLRGVGGSDDGFSAGSCKCWPWKNCSQLAASANGVGRGRCGFNFFLEELRAQGGLAQVLSPCTAEIPKPAPEERLRLYRAAVLLFPRPCTDVAFRHLAVVCRRCPGSSFRISPVRHGSIACDKTSNSVSKSVWTHSEPAASETGVATKCLGEPSGSSSAVLPGVAGTEGSPSCDRGVCTSSTPKEARPTDAGVSVSTSEMLPEEGRSISMGSEGIWATRRRGFF
mmetsp:Transcript_135996/g.322238  ORF Transcript_135996/g.322238 Transcript_135996/m.322238 type:complete len:287 (-) Transcript_135996:898-1758(-)